MTPRVPAFGMGCKEGTGICVVGGGTRSPALLTAPSAAPWIGCGHPAWGRRSAQPGLVPASLLWVLTLGSPQRQRLRELLIRQQMQRNSLRQEKENAAAAATPSPAGWTPEAGSAAFELSRAMAPGYQPAQVGKLGNGSAGGPGCRAGDDLPFPPFPGQGSPGDTGHRGQCWEAAWLRHGAGSVRAGRAALPAPAGPHADSTGHQWEVSAQHQIQPGGVHPGGAHPP